MCNHYLRFNTVHRLTGLSRTTLWRLEKAGTFPQRRRISPGSVGWLSHEITRWMQSRDKVNVPKHNTGEPL